MPDHEFIQRQSVIRHAILERLYCLRRAKKIGYFRDLTHALGHDPAECEFALDYLAEAGMVRRESVQCRITAQGMAHFEAEVNHDR